jgi:hypothetical protein
MRKMRKPLTLLVTGLLLFGVSAPGAAVAQTRESAKPMAQAGEFPPGSYGSDDRLVGYTPWGAPTNSNRYEFSRANGGDRKWTFNRFSPADHSQAPYENSDDNDAPRDAVGETMPPIYSDPSFTSTDVGYNLLLDRDTDEGATSDLQNALRRWWQTQSPTDKTRNGETSLRSNNNVSAIEFKGRYYLAVRTSSLHFANDLPWGEYRVDDKDTTSCAATKTSDLSECEVTHLLVVSAPASITGINVDDWRVETNVWLNRDIREPNFLVLNDAAGNPQSLRLFFIENGRTLTTFETGFTYYVEMSASGSWTSPVKMDFAGDNTYVPWGEGYIPWKIKTVTHPAHNGGRPVHYMLRYKGSHYGFTNPDGTPNTKPDLKVQFLMSTDGVHWAPVRDMYSGDRSGDAESRSLVYSGGGSEADFAFDKAGNLYSTIRIEDYDVAPGRSLGETEPQASQDRSMGSRTCAAPAADIADWKCVQSPFRYDSPLMFSRGDSIYLIGRRNLFPEDRDEGYGDFKENRTSYFASFPFETQNSPSVKYWDSYKGEAPTGFGTVLSLFHPGPWAEAETANIAYWIMPKRTSLFKIDAGKLWNFINAGNYKPCDYNTFTQKSSNGDVKVLPDKSYACEQSLPVKLITDFVGTNGDTSYPTLIQESHDDYLFLNYTSQFWDHTEKSWISGQISPTFLLASKLQFENSGS